MDSRAFISDGSLTSLSHAKPPSQKEIKNKLNSAERRENEIKWKEKFRSLFLPLRNFPLCYDRSDDGKRNQEKFFVRPPPRVAWESENLLKCN